MAEYMNKSLVLAGLNLRLLRLKNEHENVDKIAELENIIGAISETETEDVIERSKVDEVIKEMKDKSFKHYFQFGEYIDQDVRQLEVIELKDVLEIFKRNIGE